MLRFGLPFMPARLALWALNLSNRLILTALVSVAAAGVLGVGVRIAQVVALMVTAFQLAWPPFAYAIEEDEEARRVYRAVLTYWMLLASWVVLGLALLRVAIVSLLPHDTALGRGRQPDGHHRRRARLLRRLLRRRRGRRAGQEDPVQLGRHGRRGGGLDRALLPVRRAGGARPARRPPTALAYGLMAMMMTLRAEQVFPVGYEVGRITLLLAVAAALFVVADNGLPELGARRDRRPDPGRAGLPARAAA